MIRILEGTPPLKNACLPSCDGIYTKSSYLLIKGAIYGVELKLIMILHNAFL